MVWRGVSKEEEKVCVGVCSIIIQLSSQLRGPITRKEMRLSVQQRERTQRDTHTFASSLGEPRPCLSLIVSSGHDSALCVRADPAQPPLSDIIMDS